MDKKMDRSTDKSVNPKSATPQNQHGQQNQHNKHADKDQNKNIHAGKNKSEECDDRSCDNKAKRS